VQSEAFAKGARFVAINRRSFPGSTPFSPDELNIVMNGGNDQQRDVEIEARGHEIASFIDIFTQKQNLPPISDDGKSGGIILLGWSLGNALSLAAISSSHSLSHDVRSRFASSIRALIVYGLSLIVRSDSLRLTNCHCQSPHPLYSGSPRPSKTGLR
jgi:pimeloyl-ACP methyl ester carboxylesterase